MWSVNAIPYAATSPVSGATAPPTTLTSAEIPTPSVPELLKLIASPTV